MLSHKFPAGWSWDLLLLFQKFGLEGWGELDEEVDSGFQFVKDFIWYSFGPYLSLARFISFAFKMEG